MKTVSAKNTHTLMTDKELMRLIDKSFDAGYRSRSLKGFTPEQIRVLKMYYDHVVSFVKQKRKIDNVDKIVIEIKEKLDKYD